MPKYLDGAGLSHFWESIKPKLVTESGSGTVVSSDDAANLPPLSLTIHGKSVQDGTPSPSSPVEIRSVEGRNLFDAAAATAKRYINKSNGAVATSNGWSASDYIRVQGGASYVLSGVVNSWSGVAGAAWYDGGKAYISGESSTTNPITAPNNAAYVRISVTTENPSAVQFELGSTAADYQPYGSITLVTGSERTDIDLDGNALRSLPDGTEDVLEVDSEGNVTLTKRIGITTTATTDGISATVGTDAMSTTGDLSDGATVIYPLATPQTISLGTIDLPSLPSPSFSMHVDAAVTPTIDAEWLTEGGGKVIDAVSTRIAALESEVDALQGQVPEREVLYDTSTWTIIRYGRTVMVQVHGATATPSTSTALVTGILADYKPAYNCSATVLTSSGSSTQAARMAVYADTGDVYIVPAGYSSSASWYGTLTYIY